MKRCEQCGHSPEAHMDARCVLCGCTPQRTTFVQQSLVFRSGIHLRVTDNTRKR